MSDSCKNEKHNMILHNRVFQHVIIWTGIVMTTKMYDVWLANEDNGLEFFKTVMQSDVIKLFESAKQSGKRYKLRVLKEGDAHWIFSMKENST